MTEQTPATDSLGAPGAAEATEILSIFTQVLRDTLSNPGLVVTPQTSAALVPGWDSFAQVNLIVAVEARFGIRIRSADAAQLLTPGDFARLIQAKMAASAQSNKP